MYSFANVVAAAEGRGVSRVGHQQQHPRGQVGGSNGGQGFTRPTVEDAVTAEDTEICRSNGGGNKPTCQVCFKYDHDALSCRNRFNHSYKADDGREHHANAANT
jgi:hypothetical protein